MGDGVPIPREVSQKVYSSKYEDYCVDDPLQLYFYTALIMKGLLASAGQAMDAEACSSSETPGTTAGTTARKSTYDGLRKRPTSASSVAADAASMLTETLRGITQNFAPTSSPGTRKRKGKAVADNEEWKAIATKMEVHEKLEIRIRAKELALREQDDGSPSKARQERLLANMKKTAFDLEEQLFNASVGSSTSGETSTPGEASTSTSGGTSTSTPGGALDFDGEYAQYDEEI